MMDLYLKTPDLETMQGALADAGVLSFEFPFLRIDSRFALDFIGDIVKPTGQMQTQVGPDGEQYQTPVVRKIDGVHANLRILRPQGQEPDALEWLSSEAQTALEPYLVPAPTNPARVWAK